MMSLSAAIKLILIIRILLISVNVSIGRESEGGRGRGEYLATASKVNNQVLLAPPSWITFDVMWCDHNEWTTDEMSLGIKNGLSRRWSIIRWINMFSVCFLSFMTPALFVSYLLYYCHTAWYIIDTSPGRVSSRRVVMKDSAELHCHRSGFISKEEEWTKKKSRH